MKLTSACIFLRRSPGGAPGDPGWRSTAGSGGALLHLSPRERAGEVGPRSGPGEGPPHNTTMQESLPDHLSWRASD